ncbi:MAG TPA: protease modulator HflK [Gemmataceae bacterium]|jgi:membrane protease subunit HflK|nr:protease modulator HflK [Gemmataceae bacterium]
MSRKQPIVLEAIASGLRSFRWVALGLFVVYLCSNITLVQPGEVALVLRLGRLDGTTPGEQIKQPGLLLAFPFHIDRVIRVPVKEEGEVLVEELWKPLADSGPPSEIINPLVEGYCLTGDQNLLQARLVAKFRIADPVAFALSIEAPTVLVHDTVMAATTETIASWPVDDALRLRDERTQESLAPLVQRVAQTRLDAVHCGLTLSALEFKEVHPPRHVRAEFEKVQSARVEKATKRREAEGFASREAPKAAAERDRLSKEAIANGSSLRARATAEASVFMALEAENRRNPQLVQERIFLEALEEIMGQIGKRYLLPPKSRPGDVRIYVSEGESPP